MTERAKLLSGSCCVVSSGPDRELSVKCCVGGEGFDGPASCNVGSIREKVLGDGGERRERVEARVAGTAVAAAVAVAVDMLAMARLHGVEEFSSGCSEHYSV